MPKPAITVILPSLNVEEYIEACIKSVIGQSLRELEILCVDAGSTDGTLGILEKYASLDRRMKIIHSDVKSYGKQVNMGFDLAEGKYVAVVETDDHIEECMYEKLYKAAEENHLDFAKADFKGFRTLQNGQPVYDEGRTWLTGEIYGRILSAEDFPELYVRDVNIWKGIYDKDFLRENGIRLNETAGAAFQDIGFCFLVLLYARRGMYISDMLYCYRRDNADSSSYRPHGLRFAYQEFKRLLDWAAPADGRGLFHHYLCIRLGHVFIGEYEKILRYDKELEAEFREVVDWFQEVLAEAIGQREITEEDMGERTWAKLALLLEDEKAYARKWREHQAGQDERERRLLNEIGTDNVIIFGCGKGSMEALLFCDGHNIEVRAFSDNDSRLWGSRFHGYEVWEVSRLQAECGGAKVLISTQKHEQAIRGQLIGLGVRETHILGFQKNHF